jgi:hypothetical protein
MNWNWSANQATRICLAGLFVTLAVSVSQAAASILPVCSWPFEVSGQGLTNVATPDTNATYWVMPLDTSNWKEMVIHGTYPQARFFNFNTYTAAGSLIGTLYDAQIAPDSGSWNPFAMPTGTGAQDYTVEISPNNLGSGNFLSAGGGGFAFIVYRVYLADPGLDRTGGVGVPAVSLVDQSGNTRTLQPCPFASAETSLPNLIVLLRTSGFADAANFLEQILTAANQAVGGGTCSVSSKNPNPVTFPAATSGVGFFPNPQTTYLQTGNLCFQPGQVLVIRGKAPVYPNTYTSPPGSVFQPAFDGQIQLRYWSMCNNDGTIPSGGRVPSGRHDRSRSESILYLSDLGRHEPAIRAAFGHDLAAMGVDQPSDHPDFQESPARTRLYRIGRLRAGRRVLQRGGIHPVRMAGLL